MKHNRKIIYLLGLLFSIPLALNSYINSSFVSTFTGEKMVGLIYALASIGSILSIIFAPQIFRKLGSYKFLLYVTILDILSLISFSLVQNKWSAIFIFIAGLSLNTLIVAALDELLKIFSLDGATGKIRGAYIAISNLAWIGAQLASGTILSGFSFRSIYLVSASVMTIFLLVCITTLRNIPDPQYDKIRPWKYIQEFFGNKKIFHAYSINLTLQFFYSWMVIYTPIYLSSYLHFTWSQIGIIFSFMLIPFCIIPFHLGKYGDKIGEKKILMLGFVIISLSTLSIFFINTHAMWIWIIVLFTTRLGAATVEVMSDSYFFKHIKPENEEFVGVYRTTGAVAYFVGPAISLVAFYFIPSFNYIYLILGTFMITGIYLSSKISNRDI